MANKKLQYQADSKVIKIPAAPPLTPPGGYFSKFDLVQLPKPQQQRSFNTNVIKVPTPYPVVPGGVFASWDPRFRAKPPDSGYISNSEFIPTAATPTSLVFARFSEPSRVTANKQVDSSSSFFISPIYTSSASPEWIDYIPSQKPPQEGFVANTILPPPAVIIVAGGFQDWDPPSRAKAPQDTSVGYFLASTPVAATPAAFTGFLDFGTRKTSQSAFQDVSNTPQTIIPTYNVLSSYTDFTFQFKKKFLYQAGGFVPPPPPVVVQPYVFSTFDQPQFKKPLQDQWVQFGTVLTTTTIQPYVFSAFDNLQSGSRIFHQAGHFVLSQPQAAVVQPYIFSSFEQPQFKKLLLDIPTSSAVTQSVQPYIFSRFEQPVIARYQFFPQSVQFEQLSIANPVPPVFTGFNDFGTAQQLIGTQRRQDGSSVDFRILQPVFVPSAVQFGGWYDFGLRPAPISFKAYEQPQVVYEILVPPIPLESAFAGKRWKYQETKKTPEIKNKVLPLKSSNLAAMSYDEDKKELRLTFKTYKYENVSKKKVQNLSHGEYFQKHIKAKHPTTKV